MSTIAKFITLFVVLLGALFVTQTASAAVPFEAQGWKTQNQHIHLAFDNGQMLQTVSSPVTLTGKILLHNNGPQFHVSFLDLQDGSNTIAKVPLNVYGNGTNEQVIPVSITLDPAKFANSGWREVRLRANIDKPDREFTTARMCVNIQNGKSRSDYCGGPTVQGRCGAGAWYPDVPGNYRIIFVDCRDQQKALTGVYRAGDVVRVKSQDGLLFANIDPKFHDGNPGIVVASGLAANKYQSLKIPAGLAPGPHKLHLRSQTGVEAGAYVMNFTAG